MRQALFVALIVAGGLSLASIIINNRRRLNALAFAFVVIAVALGGSRVPVGNFPDNTPYIGLDWFILDLLGSTLIFVVIEKLFALYRNQPVFRPEWQTDLQHFVVNHMIVGFILLTVNLLVHKLFGWRCAAISSWVRDLPFVCRSCCCHPRRRPGAVLDAPRVPRGAVAVATARGAPQRQEHGLAGRLAPAHRSS